MKKYVSFIVAAAMAMTALVAVPVSAEENTCPHTNQGPVSGYTPNCMEAGSTDAIFCLDCKQYVKESTALAIDPTNHKALEYLGELVTRYDDYQNDPELFNKWLDDYVGAINYFENGNFPTRHIKLLSKQEYIKDQQAGYIEVECQCDQKEVIKMEFPKSATPDTPSDPQTPGGTDTPSNPQTPSGTDTPSNPQTPAGTDTPSDTPAPTVTKATKLKVTGYNKIAAGKKTTLKVTATPAKAKVSYTWKSSNTKVATVTSKGVVSVKAKTGGKTAIITVTDKISGKKATYKITSMKGIVKKVAIKGNKSVKAGKTLKLTAKVTATSGANKAVEWVSSNKKYATVTSKGVVKGLKAGKGKTVTITAKATDGSGKKATIKIKVK